MDRADNAEAVAKKAAERKRMRPDNRSDRIEIGTGTANVGIGAGRAIGPELSPPVKHIEADKGQSEKKGTSEKTTWIKGSTDSKKMGNRNVKSQL